jgi:hypothetical protein
VIFCLPLQKIVSRRLPGVNYPHTTPLFVIFARAYPCIFNGTKISQVKTGKNPNTDLMKSKPKKTAAKGASSEGRKPNPTTDKNKKINARGKGTRSQSNVSKVSGVGKTGAKKLPGKKGSNSSTHK